MTLPVSDALVFFGDTGDLVYKKIHPSLQAMVRREMERRETPRWRLESLRTPTPLPGKPPG